MKNHIKVELEYTNQFGKNPQTLLHAIPIDAKIRNHTYRINITTKNLEKDINDEFILGNEVYTLKSVKINENDTSTKIVEIYRAIKLIQNSTEYNGTDDIYGICVDKGNPKDIVVDNKTYMFAYKTHIFIDDNVWTYDYNLNRNDAEKLKDYNPNEDFQCAEKLEIDSDYHFQLKDKDPDNGLPTTKTIVAFKHIYNTLYE